PDAPIISSSPANPSNQTSATFAFSDTDTSASFLCKRDTGAFATCTSPITYSALGQGSHTFSVMARDAAGNQSSATSFTWTIDPASPPGPTITSGPTNPTTQTSATFTFTDTEAGARFSCQLDGAAATACSSPRAYSGLADGSHTFSVTARDAAGNQ